MVVVVQSTVLSFRCPFSGDNTTTVLLYRDHWPLAIYNFVFLNQWHIRTSYGYGVLSTWFRNDPQGKWWCKEASGAYNHITYHIKSSFLKDRVGISLVATVKVLVPLPMLPPIPTSSKNWRTGPMNECCFISATLSTPKIVYNGREHADEKSFTVYHNQPDQSSQKKHG